MKFTKMHALGNDYVYVNCFEHKIADPAGLARVISERHRGVGADGLILVGPPAEPRGGASVRMRIFNADGSEAEMCGNGIRCVAKYAWERRLAEDAGPFEIPGRPPLPASVRIQAAGGVLAAGLVFSKDRKVIEACVNMGRPELSPQRIPVSIEGERAIEVPITVCDRQLSMSCVSMGNPHAVFFCEDIASVDIERLGPAIENHRLFPNRVNAHFVEARGTGEVLVRTWERGSGPTMACGTGACAVCVAGFLTGRTGRELTVGLPGGRLEIYWCADDENVYMTGEAVEVFEGEIKN